MEHTGTGMNHDIEVIDHYGQPDLLSAIESALEQIGKTPETVTAGDLAPVDEFHIGGRPATVRLLDQLDFAADAHVLDVGCGIGGPARVAAARVGRISGFDLTPAYVETGNALNGWLGLQDTIDFRVGNATALEVDDATFDGGYQLHVGMNIEDKVGLLREVARVLKPGARFGMYDIMRLSDGELTFPVPWATEPSNSHVATPEQYRAAAAEAGLDIVTETDRSAEAKDAFQRGPGGPSPLGLQFVMGPTVGEKVKNMVANVNGGVIAPVELILRRPLT